MTTVTYAMDYPYLLNPPGGAPQPQAHAYLEIEVFYQNNSRRLWALVDTGADHVMVDSGVAANLGVPSGPKTYPVATTAGTIWMQVERSLTVDLAGATIQTDVVVDGPPTPLLGRRALLDAVEFGFGQQRWYHA
jgi:predicted aspartyl protease